MIDKFDKPAHVARPSLIVRAAKALEGHEQEVVIVAAAFIVGALFTATLVAEVTPHSKEHTQ